MDSNSEGICVAIRIRPLNDRECSGAYNKAFQAVSANSIAQFNSDNQPMEGQLYSYDKIFDENSTTDGVYQYVAKDIVTNVVRGINGTIFAYGQTSSGKTFTMLGDNNHRGVLELAAEDIFYNISQCPERDFLIRVSFVEIYNEKIFDLLSDSIEAPNVYIREDPRKGVYCETTEIIITDYESILKALRKGSTRRHVAETLMNEKSSRSHSIFRVVIESKASRNSDSDVDGAVLVASLNLVDLAGSESVRLTGATRERAKEGGKINQSLLSLSRVIQSLSQPGHHVSFRDSQLTRLLQPSLCGNAKMSIVCCITPADKYLEETKSTLQFASRAKLVQTHATVNEVVDETVQIRRLKRELEDLKRKFRKSSEGSAPSNDRAQFEAEKNELLEKIENLELEKENHLRVLDRYRDLVPLNSENVAPEENEHVTKRGRSTKRETWCPAPSKLKSNGLTGEEIDDKEILRAKVETLYSQLEFAMIVIKDNDVTIQSLTTERDEMSQRFDIEMGANAECERELRDQIVTLEESLITMTQRAEEVSTLELSIVNERARCEDLTAQLVESARLNANTQESLTSTLEEMNYLKAEIESWTERYSECNSEKIKAQEELVGYRSVNEQLSEARAQINLLVERNNQLESELCSQLDLLNDKFMSASKERDILQTQIDDLSGLKQEYESIRQQFESAVTENERLVSDISTKESDIERIQGQFSEFFAENEDLANQIKILTFKNNELSEKIQVIESEKSNLLVEFNNLQSVANESNELVIQLRNQLQEMTSRHEQQFIEAEESSNAYHELEEKITLYQEQLQALLTMKEAQTVEVNTEVLDRIATLETELAKAEELIIGLESDIKDLNAQILESAQREEKLAYALQEADSETLSFRDQIVELERQLEGSVEDYNQAQSEMIELNAIIAKLKDELLLSQEKLTNEQNLFEKNINSLTLEKISLQNKINESLENKSTEHQSISVLESKLMDAANEKICLEKVINEQDEKIMSLQALINSLNSEASKSTISYESKTKDLETECGKLSGMLGVKEAEISQLLEKVNNLESSITITEQQMSAYRNQANNALDDEQGLRKKLGQLQTNVDLIKSERDVLQRKLQDSTSEVKDLQHQLSLIEDDYTKKFNVQEKQLNSLLDLKAEYQTSQETVFTLQQIIKDLKLQNADITSRHNAACKHIDELELTCNLSENSSSRILELENTIYDLKSNLTEVQTRLGKAKDEVQLYVSELARSEEVTMKQTNTIVRLEADLENAKAVIQQVREEAKINLMASSQLEEMSDSLSEAEEKLTLANATIEVLTGEKVSLEEQILTLESQLLVNEKTVARDDNMLNEMNILLEEKLDLESRLAIAENKVKEYMDKLSDYDRNSAREQQMIMNAASNEIEALKSRLSNSEVSIDSLNKELSTKLTELADKEDSLAEAMNEIYKMRSELKQGESIASDAIQELRAVNKELMVENKHIHSEIEIKNKEIAIAKVELSKAQSEIASIRIEMDEQLEVKEKRINHLEKSKLTKDQLEKIKVMKEERKKYMDECKAMKKQLSSLKASYDDLKAGSSLPTSNGASSAATKEDLEEKYEMTIEVVKTLKEKLRECSKQLQVYETERSSVIEVLDKYGIDTTSLLPLDTSVSDDASSYSLADQDLAGAVNKLAQKFISDASSVTKKLREIEDTLSKTEFDLEEARGMRSVLEKRVEMMKQSMKVSREEYAKANEDIDTLTQKVEELTNELSQARHKVMSSSDNVHSEVQALEEENIEIMKENKELRKELSKLRAASEKQQISAKIEMKPEVKQNEPVTSEVPSISSATTRKRSFGHDITSNIENINIEASTTDGSNKGRRIRSKIVTQVESAPSTETPGECAQS